MFSLKIPIAADRDPKTGLIPCLSCTQCCHYVAIEIDMPESRREFDNIRWYLYHPGIEVYIDQEDTWNVLFHSRCENLQDDGKCAVYDTRPLICREFDNTTCEPNTDEPAEKVIFRTADDLDHWMRLTRTQDRLVLKEAAAERRRQRRAETRAAAKTKAETKAKAGAQAGARAKAAVTRTHTGDQRSSGPNGRPAGSRNGGRRATSRDRTAAAKRSR
jgi:Fe-S-cluster containining protein